MTVKTVSEDYAADTDFMEFTQHNFQKVGR